MPDKTKTRYYWVYIPEVNEAGCVVQATSFADAFDQGVEQLYPDDGAEIQIHELGESQSFIHDAALIEEV